MKNYILSTLFLILSPLAFGQASDSKDFSFKIKFDSDIPVLQLELFYIEKPGNYFKEINFAVNTLTNEIILTGHNEFIVGVSFPTLVFFYRETMIYKETKDRTESMTVFYLITESENCYSKDFAKEIRFSKSNPNIIISSEYSAEKLVYHVTQESNLYGNYNLLGSTTSNNKIIQINQIDRY